MKHAFWFDVAAFAIAALSLVYLLVSSANPFYFLLLLLVAAAGFAYALPDALARVFAGPRKGAAPRARATPGRRLPVPLSTLALAAVVAAVALYIASGAPAFAVLAFLAMVYVILNELVPPSFSRDAVRQSARELVYAFDAAVLVWFALILALGTASPIDIVTSCSMTPALDRGDLVFLQGGVANVAVLRTPLSVEEAVARVGVERGTCRVSDASGERAVPCSTALVFDGRRVPLDGRGDVVVFEPVPRVGGVDLIIHRAVARVEAADGAVYLTKGDNNAFVDQEGGFRPVAESAVHGRVVARVPYVGYAKLLLFLQFEPPANCAYQLRAA